MSELFEKVKEAAESIRKKTNVIPEVGIILGTGLGNLIDMVNADAIVDYADIPHFARSTVDSHKGRLLVGTMSDVPVAVMEGRFHYYEGYSLEEVTFPIRVMKELGIKKLIITCATGGMNATYEKGDIVLIADHINLTGLNPLVGVADDRLGCRFPDMCEPYSDALIQLAESAAEEQDLEVKQGTYAWVTGPCLETKAEYKFMHMIGADLVGMSTVPEVIVGVQCELEIVGIACITDLCIPESLQPVDIQEIIKTAEVAGPKIDHIIQRMLEKM